MIVGTEEGVGLGRAVGFPLGDADASMVGTPDSAIVGTEDGAGLGRAVGFELGIPDGVVVGFDDGNAVGISECAKVGTEDGLPYVLNRYSDIGCTPFSADPLHLMLVLGS